MNNEASQQSELIVLLVSKENLDPDGNTIEMGSFIINSSIRPNLVDTVVTGQADYFLYHMPFWYRLN